MKYMGSKARIAKDIAPIIQECIDNNNISTYVEPFVGGANMIDKIKCKKKIGSDCNKYLIALLNRVKNGLPLLEEVPRELYNNVRSNPELFEDWFVGNVGFLASYNGRWFDGGYAQSGYEKTKNGARFRDYYYEAKKNILAQGDSLRDTTFWCWDYREFYTEFVSGGYMIYFDPPYQNVKQYNNSRDFNYEEFWELVRLWSKNNFVLVSEQNAPKDFACIWEKEVSRSIKAAGKSISTEKLFAYKDGKYVKRYLD